MLSAATCLSRGYFDAGRGPLTRFERPLKIDILTTARDDFSCSRTRPRRSLEVDICGAFGNIGQNPNLIAEDFDESTRDGKRVRLVPLRVSQLSNTEL